MGRSQMASCEAQNAVRSIDVLYTLITRMAYLLFNKVKQVNGFIMKTQ